MPLFDILSELEKHEVSNLINQDNQELTLRDLILKNQ